MVCSLSGSDRPGYTEFVTGEVEILPSTTYLPSTAHVVPRSSVVSDPGTGSPGAGDKRKERLAAPFSFWSFWRAAPRMRPAPATQSPALRAV